MRTNSLTLRAIIATIGCNNQFPMPQFNLDPHDHSKLQPLVGEFRPKVGKLLAMIRHNFEELGA